MTLASSSSTSFSRRSLSRTNCSARCRSASASTSASTAVMTSLSTPLVRSSAAKARLPFPAFTRRDCTHCSAKSTSSMRPTSASRSSTRLLTSSGYPRLDSCPSSSARVLALAVSRRRHRFRACSSRDASEVDGGGQDFVIGHLSGHHGTDSQLLLDLLLDFVGHVTVFDQEIAGILLALAELLTLIGEPGTGLSDEALLDAHVDERAFPADALAVEDVELGLLERLLHLVLDHLAAGAVADRVGAVLQRLNSPDVQANRGVELQSLSARCRFWTSEHDTDFFAELVDEDRGGARIVQ